MDAVVHSALEEICCEAANGLHLRSLWSKISSTLAFRGLPLCPNVKRAVWENLVETPGLRLESRGGGTSSNSTGDLIKRTVEECEELNVRIVASEAMRKSFLGIYEMEASESSLSATQRRILERLAVARSSGIAQSVLGKELHIAANNLFYQLKRLEIQGLIVRHPTVIRKKQASDNREQNNNLAVSTNMIYLYRYGQHLGCQKRLEITKEDDPLMDAEGHLETGDDFVKESVKGDIHVKDFLPALRAICDKLEKAQGKVLVISDIKQDLGYRGTSGHRAWRNICHRLKDARVVEECCTKINKKEVNCLRLLQSFSPSLFEPKHRGLKHDDIDKELSANLSKRGPITEQVVELPILRQIYDMIDAAGSKGLTNVEVCRRLGLCSKEYHKRYFKQMISRFGLHLQLESHNRTEVYRVWTASHFNSESSIVPPTGKETVPQEGNVSMSHIVDLDFHENLPQPVQILDTSTSMRSDRGINKSKNDAASTMEAINDSAVEGDASRALLLECNSLNVDEEVDNLGHDEGLLGDDKAVTGSNRLVTSSLAVATPPKRRSYLRYRHLAMGVTSSLREQRILKMLQEEKFLIKPELHRRLENLEKGKKNTTMDRKTLDRCLKKLQQEGHLKCILMNVPVLTNCDRTRTTVVVLHPSVCSNSAELVNQIHEKMRSFEIQVRQQAHTKQKKGQPVPTLDSVQRIPRNTRFNVQSEQAELMRANGYILAKMVRAKLLHTFLWGWISSYPGWDDGLLSNTNFYDMRNLLNTCKLFKLDLAIRSMPIELFLQVVGYAQKFDDMVEKCRSGMLLCDLPMEEYKSFMDTRATGRLSWLIDILRRLKLIRLVSKGHTEDEVSSQHTTLVHALELKPYIEEPISISTSTGFSFPDMRPQVRHDFVLSNRKVVDEYWNTLEYCYGTAKSSAALLAFPGCAVHEIFHPRAWATTGVMTAEQRVELLKRVSKDPNKKLSFSECDEIAKDLNLSLEQVLRAYHDKTHKRQRRFTRFQSISDAEQNAQTVNLKHSTSLNKRKRCANSTFAKLAKARIVNGQASAQDVGPFSDSNNPFTEEQQSLLTTSKDYDHQLHRYYDGDCIEDPDVLNLNENEVSTFIYKQAFPRTMRQKRFSWTEAYDRQLVMEYAKHRAELGAKFHRVNWSSISNLPASPDACRRRISVLKGFPLFRKAVMNLCNLLAERYANYLKIIQDNTLADGWEPVNQEDSLYETVYEEWVDFDDNVIKVALDEVMTCKRMAMAKLEAKQDDLSDHGNSEGDDLEGCSGPKTSGQRSRSRQLARKYSKLLNGGVSVSRQMHESVAVANAAELFKLIFLSKSKAPEAPTLQAGTLRRYSEHDLFAAFNYLREKKIIIGGSNNSPFELSQHFMHSISSSAFPPDAGKKAVKFFSWLDEREKDLMEGGIDVPSDMQCSEVLTLCALVSSGELLITPFLPSEGVGEAEDNRSKRKYDGNEVENTETYKKLKTSLPGEGEMISRREKGFPGIKLLLHREAISRTLAIEAFKQGPMSHIPSIGGKCSSSTLLGLDFNRGSSHLDLPEHEREREIFNSGSILHPALNASKSPWEFMTNLFEYLMPTCSHEVKSSFPQSGLFKALYSAIQKAGDNGLSMKEIHKVLQINDDKILEVMIEVLEAFGRILKVNAYDSVHVVDSLYRSKYFLTTLCDHTTTHVKNQEMKSVDGDMPLDVDNLRGGVSAMEHEINRNANEVHRVTILNLPEVAADVHTEVLPNNQFTDHQHSEVPTQEMNSVTTFELHSVDTKVCRPLLPWMNVDGTTNEVVYDGLVRRVLGIVMQNPGILEDGIIRHMHGLSPQSCRQLLELLILDKHLIARKMQQMTSSQPPSILGDLLGNRFRKSKLIHQIHYFANPMSTALL